MISPPSVSLAGANRGSQSTDASGSAAFAETLLLKGSELKGPELKGSDGAPEEAGTWTGHAVEWTRVPRVNLLPPEIIEARRFHRARAWLIGLVVGVVGLCGTATTLAQNEVASARSALEITRAETESLRKEQVRFTEVPKVSTELDAARAARGRALGSDILWYRFLTDLAVNTPEGTTLQSVSISMTTAAGANTSNQPLTPTGLGTIKVSGEATQFADVASWLEACARVNGLVGTTLQSAVRGDAGSGSAARVAYSGGAVISTAALSHRYDRKAG